MTSEGQPPRPIDHDETRHTALAVATMALPLLALVVSLLVFRYWPPSMAWKLRVPLALLLAGPILLGAVNLALFAWGYHRLLRGGIVFTALASLVVIATAVSFLGLVFGAISTVLAFLILANGALRRKWPHLVGLASLGIMISSVLAVSWIWAVQAAHRESDSQSLSDLRQLSLAVYLYAQDHDGTLPEARRWCDQIAPYVAQHGGWQAFRSPYVPHLRCAYAFNAAVRQRKVSAIKHPAATIMLFESDRGWNASGDPEIMAPAARHYGMMPIAFVDGHARGVRTQHPLPRRVFGLGAFGARNL